MLLFYTANLASKTVAYGKKNFHAQPYYMYGYFDKKISTFVFLMRILRRKSWFQMKIYEFSERKRLIFQYNFRRFYIAFLSFKNFWRKSYLTEVLNFLAKPIFYVLIKKIMYQSVSPIFILFTYENARKTSYHSTNITHKSIDSLWLIVFA